MDKDRENQIIARVLAGDQDEFFELVNAYKDPLFSLTYMMSRNYPDAADLVQETFVRAYRSLKRFDRNRRFFPWIYSICINLNRSYLKKTGKLRSSVMSLEEGQDVISHHPDPEESLIEKETMTGLRNALQSLSVDCREVLLLRFHQGLSFEDISEILNISEEAAKKRTYRALEKLKSIVDL